MKRGSYTYYIDPETGDGRYGKTNQGFSDDSCWSRGQAWGIYGFSLGYRYTQEQQFRDTAKKLANYFLDRLPEVGICYWDMIFDEGADEEKDSSAAAIAAAGLLEFGDFRLVLQGAANVVQPVEQGVPVFLADLEGEVQLAVGAADGLLAQVHLQFQARVFLKSRHQRFQVLRRDDGGQHPVLGGVAVEDVREAGGDHAAPTARCGQCRPAR